MRFAITGSTGFIGSALTRRLRDDGHDIVRIVRSRSRLPHQERVAVWHPDSGAVEAAALEGLDVVIHLAGENVAGVWTEAKKRRIRDSRLRSTDLIARTLAALERPPRILISASAFGFYGDRPGETLDEDSPKGIGFLADLAAAWEAATRPAEEAGIRVVFTRFGNVLGRGGMLGTLVPLFKLGLGARFGDGTQYWPWIALDDIAPAMLHIIDHKDIRGPVNFTAPQYVTNAEFTDALAAVLGRPSILRVPAFAARLAPGDMADEMLLGSARVVPRRLIETGYEFRCLELKSTLKSVVG